MPLRTIEILAKEFDDLLNIDEVLNEADDIADYVEIAKDLWGNEVVDIPVGGIRVYLGSRKIESGIGMWALPIPGPIDEVVGTIYILWGVGTIGIGLYQIIVWSEEDLS